ncbi:hypothetical protein [Mycobacterium simiae]|uniref:hypothetical protein n=1 Tax=Mycobacterium simiae TaxID=1784 RepID=UPI0020CADF62|nr:hypothetical protein [Mycobacterium simiae]
MQIAHDPADGPKPIVFRMGRRDIVVILVEDCVDHVRYPVFGQFGSDDRDVAPGRRDCDDRVLAEILRQRVVFAEISGGQSHQRMPIDLLGQQVSRWTITDDRMKDGMVFNVGDLEIAT